MSGMDSGRFASLAEDLARVQGGLSGRLGEVRAAAEALRGQAFECVEAFCRRARELGAHQLEHVVVSDVGPDEKHVDCVQFSVSRGRAMLLCVAIAGETEGAGKVRLVGPFKRGKIEGPCGDFPLRGPEVEAGLEQRMIDLLRTASSV
jgi:hypothetical protein